MQHSSATALMNAAPLPAAARRRHFSDLHCFAPLCCLYCTRQLSAMYQSGPHLQSAAPQPWAAGAQWQQGVAAPQLPTVGVAEALRMVQPAGELQHQLHLAVRRAAAAEERCHALEQQLAALQQENSALSQQLAEARAAAARAEAESERRMAAVGRLLADQASASTAQQLARLHLGSNGSEHAPAAGAAPAAPALVPAAPVMPPALPSGYAPPPPPFMPGKCC